MKIGLLAYHAACNFGAFLQLLSTVEYIKKIGYDPIVINWVPKDFREDYERRSLEEVRKLYSKLQQQYYHLSELCETAVDVAHVIKEQSIKAVIVGSDAVTQHHPLRSRIVFPCKRIIAIAHPTSDRMFPNCFWGIFNDYLEKPVPVALISGSSQDSKFYYITGKTKERMKAAILKYCYVSVRDEWTQKMVSYLTDEEIHPSITPDPVFAFNQNALHFVPSKEEILKKYCLPDDYMILSFKGTKSVSQDWIDDFQVLANNKGISCVKLPYADAQAFGNVQYSVGDVITPIEWYALIKYSRGYIGNNMHPIVTSLANGVPFYSFDNYGIIKNHGLDTDGESSKIYHILNAADFLSNRVYIRGPRYKMPLPCHVFDSIMNFDRKKEMIFAKSYLDKYNEMMRQAISSIEAILCKEDMSKK